MQESNKKILQPGSESVDQPVAAEYQAPGIDAVMTPEELEREVLYAGDGTFVVCSI